jgi:hypothetical protein
VDVNTNSAVRLLQAVTGSSLITTFGELEFVNAISLRVFRREISPGKGESSIADFEQDLRDGIFQLKPLPDHVFQRARLLSRQTTPQLGTRTADLLHVAAALEVGAAGFYSFDVGQRKLARNVKLKLNVLR